MLQGETGTESGVMMGSLYLEKAADASPLRASSRMLAVVTSPDCQMPRLCISSNVLRASWGMRNLRTAWKKLSGYQSR